MKSLKLVLCGVLLASTLCVSLLIAPPITSPKINQMIQNVTVQTAQLSALVTQPIFSETSLVDVAALKSNVVKDIQNIRNDLKKIISLLQTLSANQQEILKGMQ